MGEKLVHSISAELARSQATISVTLLLALPTMTMVFAVPAAVSQAGSSSEGYPRGTVIVVGLPGGSSIGAGLGTGVNVGSKV